MKRKLKNITVPYLYYNKKTNSTCYIYQDKEYTDFNKLFLDFVGMYLTYHYKINEELKEVHNLSDVIVDLIRNKDTFSIPTKYKKEYSKSEYHYLTKLQTHLKENKLKIGYAPETVYHFDLQKLKDYKLYKFTKRIYENYKDVIIPKIVYSEEYHNYYYVVAGSAYENIYQALDEVFDEELYYEFGGTKRANNRSHSHCHNFDHLIHLIFDNCSNFKIHMHQQELYSEQELLFLQELATKLKKLKFHSVPKPFEQLDSEEYIYLKENKKLFSLLIYNINYVRKEKKYQRDVLNSHKI